jgi:hypothetical protein
MEAVRIRDFSMKACANFKGFATGNSNNKIYDGQFLADSEDVVVVSFK